MRVLVDVVVVASAVSALAITSRVLARRPARGAGLYYDVWSNVHYGYVGAATGIDEDFLEFGASPGLEFDRRRKGPTSPAERSSRKGLRQRHAAAGAVCPSAGRPRCPHSS
ncbi:polymorphic toxin type 44 domain-containing protein [Streptomyces albiflavescens]|uniref:polymorphic toxin type 44 domain-containing protein n=1 Tax=Streptomyces albiflavescens TaxID=1623582 RepID=UPI001E5E699F|nr:polymorphic toxin type 44 domain-containing protein [Streptomyces albiflavescens]